MESWLQDDDIEIYSTHNEEKSVVAERLIRTLKKKCYKYMFSLSKNMHIDKLDDIVHEYNNAYFSTIKMKPADVKSSTYIDFYMEKNDKNLRFEFGENVRYLNIKALLPTSCTPNW